MTPHERRDKMFEYYGRGVLDANEVNTGVSELMFLADDDDAALALLDEIPDWFRENFREWMSEIADQDYAFHRTRSTAWNFRSSLGGWRGRYGRGWDD